MFPVRREAVKNGRSFYSGFMPRVSDEHLAARRQQILDAAWKCFATQGFHATSMQDVFAEAGLSAGAVYRYFPSKADLVHTTAHSLLGSITGVFDDMLARDHPPRPEEAMRTTLDFVTSFAGTGSFDRTRITLHVWAESLHDDQIQSLVSGIALEIRRRWTQLAERWIASGDIAADASPENVAKTLYGVMIGFVIQRHLVGDVDAESYADGLRALLNSP